jgi:hypothetical protein
MVDRSTEATVTFLHPFTLESIGSELPAGSYRVITDEVEIPGLSFLAYAHAATLLHVPAIGSKALRGEVFTVGHTELADALAKDATH